MVPVESTKWGSKVSRFDHRALSQLIGVMVNIFSDNRKQLPPLAGYNSKHSLTKQQSSISCRHRYHNNRIGALLFGCAELEAADSALKGCLDTTAGNGSQLFCGFFGFLFGSKVTKQRSPEKSWSNPQLSSTLRALAGAPCTLTASGVTS